MREYLNVLSQNCCVIVSVHMCVNVCVVGEKDKFFSLEQLNHGEMDPDHTDHCFHFKVYIEMSLHLPNLDVHEYIHIPCDYKVSWGPSSACVCFNLTAEL